MIRARDRILPPYVRRVDDFRHRALKAVGILAAILFAMVMGFWIGIFYLYVTPIFVGLLGVLFLVALWMADDMEPGLRRQIGFFFLLFVGLYTTWPLYLAIDIPGLPWLTPARIVLAWLMLLFLLEMSQSANSRREFIEVIAASKPTFVFLALFWMTAMATIFLSKTPGESMSYTVQAMLLWNMPFLVGLWVLRDPTVAPRMVTMLILLITFVFILTVLEYPIRKPIWLDHVPAFLKIDGPLFSSLMQEQGRVGDDRYRARGNFAVHLYYAQYILLILPFVIHRALTEPRLWARGAAAMLVLFTLVVCWMTNTRTALTGFVVVTAGSFGIWGLRRFLNPNSRSDIMAPAILLAVPAALVVVAGLVAASPRLQVMMLGGSQHASSDMVRDEQWDNAWAALQKNPFGHGGNSAAPLAGRPTSDGLWIVDSAWINFLLDFGVLGALFWTLFCGTVMLSGLRIYLTRYDDSADLAGPAAVAVGSYLMSMYTVSFLGSAVTLMVLTAIVLTAKHRLQTAGVKMGLRAQPQGVPVAVAAA